MEDTIYTYEIQDSNVDFKDLMKKGEKILINSSSNKNVKNIKWRIAYSGNDLLLIGAELEIVILSLSQLK